MSGRSKAVNQRWRNARQSPRPSPPAAVILGVAEDPARSPREAQIFVLDWLVEPWTLINDCAHAARQSLSSAPPEESDQRRGGPDIRPDPRFEAKTSRGPKLAALKQRTASSTFQLQISGRMNGDLSTEICSLRALGGNRARFLWHRLVYVAESMP